MGRLKATLITFVLWLIMGGIAIADVYINVMAVNGATERRETPIQFNLPADLAVENIIDTDGLKLEYNAADANYYVQGNVTLEPKESKTFRIRLRNIWKIAPEQIQDIKQQIQEGYEQLGKLRNEKNADTLKADLIKRLDYIVQQQANQSGNVERKIDAFRTYSKEMAWIKNQALAIDYWRSQPGDNQARIIRMTIEIENPATSVNKSVKARQYLPSDVRPENLVDDQDFETRYDQVKQQTFLYKEDEIEPGQKRKYVIGIRDVWHIFPRDVDYLRSRSVFANDFLKNSRYNKTSKYLFDRASVGLADIEVSQARQKPIQEHISSYRDNVRSLEQARTDVETIEKLVSAYREELEKTKVQNVLQKVRSLNWLSELSQVAFGKKPTQSTSWNFISWILGFVAFLTVISLLVSFIRSRDKAVVVEAEDAKSQETVKQEKT